MAEPEDIQKKCFTFIWKVSDAIWLWQKRGECIVSLPFIVGGVEETKYRLRLIPKCGEMENSIGFYLQREADCPGPSTVPIVFDLAFLSPDGTILKSTNKVSADMRKKGFSGPYPFASWKDIFVRRKSLFMPQGTLTTRCRIWKADGDDSKDILCVSLSRISVERRSFVWEIGNFSTLESGKRLTYDINSVTTGKLLMTLELFVTDVLYSEEIHFAVADVDERIKSCTLELLPVDVFGTPQDYVKDYLFRFEYPFQRMVSKQFFLKSYFTHEEHEYLPDDVFYLMCVVHLCYGIQHEEIERVYYESRVVDDGDPINFCKDEKDDLAGHKCILSQDLKSMLEESIQADVQLRTTTKTYPAHKAILSARSPVFKAMFLNDMVESKSDCVDIKNMYDDTLSRMLQYMYGAEVDPLEWRTCIELYEASDRYEILSLRDLCATYLQENLSVKTACDALVLADSHSDVHLKVFVQHFILSHGTDVMNSDEWNQLMKSNLELAAETMHLNYKK